MANNAWAVGFSRPDNSTPDNGQTLIEHFDGTAWTVMTSPNVASANNELLAIRLLSTTDIWAVGDAKSSSTSSRALIEHYDGSSWTIVSGPLTDGLARLSDLLAFSANDVWAVGQVSNGAMTQPLLEHWDGTSWTVPPYVTTGLPPTNTSIAYNSIDGLPGDIWVVGWSSTGSSVQTFTQHYDGRSWAIIPSPSPGQGDQLVDVRYRGLNDAWAFGSTAYAGAGTPNELDYSLIEHWNGIAWSQFASPNPTSNQTLVSGDVMSLNLILAVGSSEDRANGAPAQTLAAQFCEPTPGIYLVVPRQGPAAGGNTVTLYGGGFFFSRGVNFGSAPASSYTVDSESQITAVAPAQPIGTTVAVTVTTADGGQSTAGNTLARYTSVGVPGPWLNHGGVLAASPTVITSGAGHLDAFVRGIDNQIWHLDASKNTWEALSGLSASSDAAAVATGAGRFAVFARGSDSALWHNDFDGTTWGGWASLGGRLAGRPAAISLGPGKLDIFVEGTDKRLYYFKIDGATSFWVGLFGVLAGPPSVVSTNSGQIDAFVMGEDRQLWRWTWYGGPSPFGNWVGLGGQLAAPPVVTITSTDNEQVFVEGTDSQLWNLTTGAWVLIGGRLGAAPAAISWGDGHLDVAVRGADGKLWHAWSTAVNTDWSWEGLGGVLVGSPAIATLAPGQLDIFVHGGDNRLWHLPFS